MRPAWQHDKSRQERGYGRAWELARERVLIRDCGLCQVCRSNGRVTLATEVDHIVPKAKRGADDDGNLQAICKPCHRLKTYAENGRTAKVRIGLDGLPMQGRGLEKHLGNAI